MKTKRVYNLIALSILFFLLSATNVIMAQSKSSRVAKPIRDTTVCCVCGMKIYINSSYDVKYKGVKYYFDTYNCKATFKLNPEKFINNVCTPPAMSK